MGKLIGVGGSVYVDEDEYPVTSWSLSQSVELQDATATNDNGWRGRMPAISEGELQFTAFWGSAMKVLAQTFAIGTLVTADCYIGSDGDGFTISGLVSSFTVTNPAKSPVEFQCTIASDGEITYFEAE